MKSVTKLSRKSECTFEWKIEDFDKAMMQENKTLVSSSFMIPGQMGKFILRVKEVAEHIDGCTKVPHKLFMGESNGWAIKWYFAVTLEAEGEGKILKAAATLEMIKDDGVMKGKIGDAASHNFLTGDKHQFRADHGARYYNNNCNLSKSTASNFYTKGKTSEMTLRATITTPGKLLNSMEAEGGDTSKMFNFRPMFKDPKFTDITLKCQDKVLPCHRIILSSSSSVFERMFETNMAEAKSGEVEIEDMSASTLERLLEFTYTGEVTDMQDVMELLYAADKYQMSDLVRMCAGHLQGEITPAMAPDILALADRHNVLRLKQVVMERILCDKSLFMGDPEFKEKMRRQPDMLMELLAAN